MTDERKEKRPNWNQHVGFRSWLLSMSYAHETDGKFGLWISDGVACYMYEAYCFGLDSAEERCRFCGKNFRAESFFGLKLGAGAISFDPCCPEIEKEVERGGYASAYGRTLESVIASIMSSTASDSGEDKPIRGCLRCPKVFVGGIDCPECSEPGETIAIELGRSDLEFFGD